MLSIVYICIAETATDTVTGSKAVKVRIKNENTPIELVKFDNKKVTREGERPDAAAAAEADS